MLALLGALLVVSVSPQMVNAMSMNECPAGWTEHRPDGKRICYRQETTDDETLEFTDARALCNALHKESTIVMPKTTAQLAVLNSYRKNQDDPNWDTDFLGIKLDEKSGKFLWLDDDVVDVELSSIHHDWHNLQDKLQGEPCTGECPVFWYYSFGDKFYRFADDHSGGPTLGDGKQMCQIIIPEWSCLADRVKTATSPFSHFAHQAFGCRQVLTCSARVMEDGALVNGLTVNLKQSPYGGGVSADIDLVLQEDLLVSIAFTEGTSPRSEDDAVTCNAESLGLFLSHHNPAAGHHGLGLLSAILSGHSQAGHPYPAGLHALGHGVFGHGYGGIYQTPRTLVKEVAVTGGVKSTFNVQQVGGFTSLAELAGHGVVVCPSDKVEEEDGVMRCLSDAIPVCCSLAWALEADEQYLK